MENFNTRDNCDSKWYNIEQFLKRQQICKDLRTCLALKKEGIPLRKLNEEFKLFTGCDIPYDLFDCNDLKSFLLKLKNVHIIEDDDRTELVIVNGIEFGCKSYMEHNFASRRTRKRSISKMDDNCNRNLKKVCKQSKKLKKYSNSNRYNPISRTEVNDQHKNLNSQFGFEFDTFCSMFPIFYNHQAMGDDHFVEIAEKYFGSLTTTTNGILQCGLCIQNQTIQELLEKVQKLQIIAPRVVIMIGNNDLKKQVPIEIMIKGLEKLVHSLKLRGVKVTLVTLIRPPHTASKATINAFKKYNFSIRSYATNPESKCHVIDMENSFRSEARIFHYYSNSILGNNERKYNYPSMDASVSLNILKRKLVRQHEVETMRFYK